MEIKQRCLDRTLHVRDHWSKNCLNSEVTTRPQLVKIMYSLLSCVNQPQQRIKSIFIRCQMNTLLHKLEVSSISLVKYASRIGIWQIERYGGSVMKCRNYNYGVGAKFMWISETWPCSQQSDDAIWIEFTSSWHGVSLIQGNH